MMFRVVVAALGLMNFGFGILAFAQPTMLAGWVGLELGGPAAFGEVRAVLGGAVAVVGVFFIAGLVAPRPSPLFGALSLVFGGLCLGRVASLAIDGWSLYTLAAFTLEAAITGVTAYAWRHPEVVQAGPDPSTVGAGSPAARD